jgi:hypothetical protein
MSKKYPINCGDVDIEVTANCYHFLERFLDFQNKVRTHQIQPYSSSVDVRYIWIDAICINQDSLVERAFQVRIMDRIYQQARKVLIWLGPADELTAGGFEALKQVAIAYKESINTKTSSKLRSKTHKRRKNGLPSLRQELSDISATQWQGVVSLYRRTWFTRAWAVQEFVLAKEPSIICGPIWTSWGIWIAAAFYLVTLNWLHFLTAVEYSTPNKMLEEEDMAEICRPQKSLTLLNDIEELCIAPIVRLDQIRNWQDKDFCQSCGVSKDEFPLQVLLGSLYSSQCTEKVDRIYAFLSLVPRSGWKGLSIDYERSEKDTYVQATWAMMASTKSLSILSHVEDKVHRKGSSIPSWVPNYSVSHTLRPLDTGFKRSLDGSSSQHFNCAKNSVYTLSSWSMASYSISVFGLLQGSIQDLGESQSAKSDLAHLQESREVLSCICKFPEERLWRTLISEEDVANKSYSATENSRKYLFDYWLAHLAIQVGKFRPDTLARFPYHITVRKNIELQRLFRGYIAFTRGHRIPNGNILDAIETEEDLSLDSIRKYIDEDYSESYQRDLRAGKRVADIQVEFGSVMSSLAANMAERRLFTMSTQRLGKGPTSIQKGDEVWILRGAKVPYILRPVRDGKYELVGEAYVHGIMQGETVSNNAIDEFKAITLV